eukprot:CAMPEP_0197176570 /NCGR_PEP_ID=MMETSP1423-20130617/2446_1 /TAXON_ID=476441 /ORGANISM="Pseudo-nitzschia heimii, Strain UNC1101" /LENGTH=202 /DNA_ID=CAMNT_0042625955 /DNA_START=110 /DNA_END=718 /DNA_ORIENTATION=-
MGIKLSPSAAMAVSFLFAMMLISTGFRDGVAADALTINQVSAKTKRPTTWLIDGNNFLGQRGVQGLPRDGDKLAEKLLPISGRMGGSSTPNEVMLVFDGRRDVDTERTTNKLGESFTKVQLEHGIIADTFLIEEMEAIRERDPSRRVKLVTADKRLRAQALGIRPTVKQVVNPKIFWKKYVPRMSGQKMNPTPHLPRNSDGD